MMHRLSYDPIPHHQILEQAAEWLALIQSGEMTELEKRELEMWCSRSPQHRAAWQRAEALLDTFDRIPPVLGRETLQRATSHNRRHVLKMLFWGALATSGSLAGYRVLADSYQQADYVTRVGERTFVQLHDDTHVALNTDTAVDIRSSANGLQLILQRGELLVSRLSSATSPLAMVTPHGVVHAWQGRFDMRLFADMTQLTVIHGAALVETQGHDILSLAQGMQCQFDHTRLRQSSSVEPGLDSWVDGKLVVSNWRLGTLVAELSRYRRGMLRCDPAVADLRISGTFPITDTSMSLAMLRQSLPVQIHEVTPWWVTIKPA